MKPQQFRQNSLVLNLGHTQSFDNCGKTARVIQDQNPIETFVKANRTQKLSETLSRFNDNDFDKDHEQSTQTQTFN